MRLLTLQFKNDTSLEGHFVRFDALLKAEISWCEVGKCWYVVMAIETLSIVELTIEFVKRRLLDEETKKQITATDYVRSSYKFFWNYN